MGKWVSDAVRQPDEHFVLSILRTVLLANSGAEGEICMPPEMKVYLVGNYG